MSTPTIKSGTAAGPTLDKPQLRSMQRQLADASDPQLMRILAMVDAMQDRGEADQLIAPLRPRLSKLRPRRPMSLPRLLFTPLNPIIVSGPEWRRGMLAVPRTALQPLADLVRDGATLACANVERRVSGLTTAHSDEIAAIGREIWPIAAELLRTRPAPENWTEATGLQEADFKTIATQAAAGLTNGECIWRLIGLAQNGRDPADFEFEELLGNAMQGGPDDLAIVMALLAARLPRAEVMLIAAEDVVSRQAEPALRQAADRAVDAMLDGMDSQQVSGPTLGLAVGELRRMVGLLEDIDARSSQRPTRRAKIEKIRQQIDTASRQKFTATLDTDLLKPAGQLAAASDQEVTNLEIAARGLRHFEQAARRLGGAEQYDRQLRNAAEALRPQADETPQTFADRVRLIEILQGSEAAAALLGS